MKIGKIWERGKQKKINEGLKEVKVERKRYSIQRKGEEARDDDEKREKKTQSGKIGRVEKRVAMMKGGK